MRRKYRILAGAIGLTLGVSVITLAAIGFHHRWVMPTQVDAIDWAHADGPRLSEIERALPGNAALRNALMQRLHAAGDLATKNTIAQLLAAGARDETLAQARKWAASADAGERADAFVLWMGFPPSAEVFELALRAIAQERSAEPLALALVSLRPILPPSPAQARILMPQLVRLTAHDAPLVRAHAVQQLADWDKSGEVAEPIVFKGLTDAEHVVRQAAVGAVMIGSLRSTRLKPLLLALLANKEEEVRLREAAANALERFVLSDAEHSAFLLARQEIDASNAAR